MSATVGSIHCGDSTLSSGWVGPGVDAGAPQGDGATSSGGFDASAPRREGGSATSPDGAPPRDAATPDAMTRDASTMDAAAPDAMIRDASPMDAASPDGDGNFTIGPNYTAAPEVLMTPAVKGTVQRFTLSSTTSKIFPTDYATKMPFTRDVAVYIPAQYQAGTAAPFMVVQDGIDFYLNTMTVVLDNMIHARELPVMIAVFVNPGPNEGTPNGERSFEYDSISDRYLQFIETELLPMIEHNYNVTLTTDPDGRAAMGGSSGGAASFTMGWFHPELYHRILTYSGSFTDLQMTAAYPLGAWGYPDLVGANPAKPLRVALEAGQNDLNWNTASDMDRDWLPANQRMAAALAAKGYHYRYVYALNAGHIDTRVLAQTLPDTLRWLWQGYPIP